MNRIFKLFLATVVAVSTQHHHSSSAEIIQDSADFVDFGHLCDGYDGVLRLRSGDPPADAASVFFMYTINQLMYAQKYNLLPWVHYDYYGEVYDSAHHPFSMFSFKMIDGGQVMSNEDDPDYPYPSKPVYDESKMSENTFLIKGNGIWNHYFLPVVNFGLFRQDPSCISKPYLQLSHAQIKPGIKYNAPWAVRAYQYSHGSKHWQQTNPKFVRSEGQSLNDWYGRMRVRAALIVKKHYKLQPWLQQQVDQINPIRKGIDKPCLALHIRRNSNDQSLKTMMIHDFTPYVQSFVEEGGDIIYISTDSSDVFQYINKDWPTSITSLMRTNPLTVEDHHTTNTKELTDIYAMAKCELLIHGFSPMAEAAIYLNIGLHEHSINLEDPDHKNVETFRIMVKTVQEKAISA